MGKLTAISIVKTKLVETLAGAGQHHNAGPGRHGRTRANHQ
jgi:hypothetical protein